MPLDDIGIYVEDDDDGYVDGSCPECGAGPDEQCEMDCSGDDEDEEDEL